MVCELALGEKSPDYSYFSNFCKRLGTTRLMVFFCQVRSSLKNMGLIQLVSTGPSWRKSQFCTCHELLVSEHLEKASKSGTEIYMTSEAKFSNEVDKACKRLSEIASRYLMIVLMANFIGPSDGHKYVGKTLVWNSKGILAGQLDDANEGIIIFDTDIQQLVKKSRYTQMSFA